MVEEFLCSKTLAKPALMHQVTLVPKQQVISQHTPRYMQQQLFIAGFRANLKSHQTATLSHSALFKPLFKAGGGCHTCHWNNYFRTMKHNEAAFIFSSKVFSSATWINIPLHDLRFPGTGSGCRVWTVMMNTGLSQDPHLLLELSEYTGES